MSLFEKRVGVIETAAKTVFWMCFVVGFVVGFVLLLSGHMTVPMAVAIGLMGVSRVVLHEVRRTWTRWDEEAAEEAEIRRQQRLLKRERELRLRIRRLQRPDR
ncbi:hypothetical protein ACLQ2R_13785 [Streptosporangium sp. DT93]|uniref:hypothetical protein n=1 Tax=Streptosporangium sp. DT93 TaxID=3393428 RepID=UPI003CEA6098